MKKTLNDEFIRAIREKAAGKTDLPAFLAEVLGMGKGAVYRRLRGEVPFTFDEVALASDHLGISLDRIVGNNLSKGTVFDFNLHHSPNAMENYHNILIYYLKLFKQVKNEPSGNICTAANTIPYTLYSPFEYLSRFRLFRWLHQNECITAPTTLGEIPVPEKTVDIHRELSATLRQVARTSLLWDRDIFWSFVREIRYFAGLNFISENDVAKIKEELLKLLDELEIYTVKGEFSEGHSLSVYLSDISFEATYTYIEKEELLISLLRIYSINSMDSQNTRICDIQKNWLRSLKRHSVLISQSAEIQRVAFFEKQREIVNRL